MFADVNGTKLYYHTHGQGRPLLLMHGGLGLDHTAFPKWFDQLGNQLELIYYDHRGNGRSERPKTIDDITHKTWAADADALRAYLGHERIILFGHSYGSFLAQEYALRYGEHLDGLILCSSAPVIDYMDVIQANAQARGTEEQLAGINDAFGRPMEDDADFQKTWMTVLPLYFNNYNPKVAAAMDESTLYSAAAWNHVNANCLPAFNTLPRLGEISTPTLIITGADDWITPRRREASACTPACPNQNWSFLRRAATGPGLKSRINL